jgi:hypothetical protein
MFDLRWMLRMARWSRRPPSQRKVMLVLGVLVACLALAALPHFGLWPDWLHVNGRPKIKFR